MKFLTFEQIQAQLRLDDQQATDEHDLLELYGEAAEDMVLNTCNRTITDIYEQYGTVPKALVQAGLILVAQSYQHREPVSPQNLYSVPAFDMLLKPYMRLTSGDTEIIEPTLLGSDVKIVFTVCLPDDMTLADVNFTGKVYNTSRNDAEIDFTKADAYPIGDGERYCFMFNSDELGVGRYMLRLTVHVPDTDYPAGYSKEVVNIDPKINVIS